MGSSPIDPKLSTKRSRSGLNVGCYSGPAVINDGASECENDIEIHTSLDKNDVVMAWHAIIRGRLAHELRFPAGKPVSVLLPDGGEGTGILVDPQLIRGVGKPPC